MGVFEEGKEEGRSMGKRPHVVHPTRRVQIGESQSWNGNIYPRRADAAWDF